MKPRGRGPGGASGGRPLRGFALLLLGLSGLAAAGLFFLYRAFSPGGPAGASPSRLSLTRTLGEGAPSPEPPAFARVIGPRPFSFPADHGPHPAYRSEWWYFTGNLEDASGRGYGFQLTFFRFALAPPPGESGAAPGLGNGTDSLAPPGSAARSSRPAAPRSEGAVSPLRASQTYMAHFALSRLPAQAPAQTSGPGASGSGKTATGAARAFGTREAEGLPGLPASGFRAFERFARGAPGLADTGSRPFLLRLGNWSAASLGAAEGFSDTAFLPLRLKAAEAGFALDLVLFPGKPLLLQGDRGYSRKGPEPGNASHYYSFTRLPAKGRVRFGDGGNIPVTGEAWMDREWGSSILSPGQAGWDWFALRLSSGEEITFFRLRGNSPESSPSPSGEWRAGSIQYADGSSRALLPEEARLDILSTWTSRRGPAYPSRWRLSLPREELSLLLETALPDQELDLSFRYYEGALRLSGLRRGKPVSGKGFVELTGYDGSL